MSQVQHQAKRPPFLHYEWTHEADELVRDAYERKTRTATSVARTLGVAGTTVCYRAGKLGLFVRHKKLANSWDKEEIDILESRAHESIESIVKALRRKGFKRTPNSVRGKMNRMNIERELSREGAGICSATALAPLLGAAPTTIARWITRGWLKATPSNRGAPGHPTHGRWDIHIRDVREFLITHTAHVDFAKIDKFWLVDVLCPKGAKV